MKYSPFIFRPLAIFPSLVILSGLCFSASADSLLAAPIADDAALYLWHFDEGQGLTTAGDAAKSSANFQGDASWGTGKFGKAVDFGGKDGRVKIEGEGVLQFAANESYTVDAWIKVLRSGSTQQIISSSPLFELEVRPEGIVSYNMGALDGSINARCRGTSDVADGKWHHVAAVRDVARGKLRLFVDGELDDEVNDPTANKLAVGIHNGFSLGATVDGREPLQGAIDEVRISRGVRAFAPVKPAESELLTSRFALENGRVRMSFAQAGSKVFLERMIDKTTGLDLMETGLSIPRTNNIWKISMRSGAGTDDTKAAMLEESKAVPTVTRKKSSSGEELRFTWSKLPVGEEKGKVDVTARIYLPANSALSQWRIDVDNSSALYGAWIVKYPTINNFRKLKEGAKDDYLVFAGGGQGGGAGEGQLNPDPFTTVTPKVRTYPCYEQSMQFNAYYGPRGGVYLATYDGAMNLKGFNLAPLKGPTPTMNYEVENYPANSGVAGTDFEGTYPAIVGPFQGDWYDAGKLYRNWALKQVWARKGPLHQRKDISPTIMKGSFWMLGTFEWEPTNQPFMRKLARTLPIEEVQKRARHIDVEKSLALVKEANDYFGYPIILWSNEWFDGGGDYSPPRYVPMNNLDKYLSELHKRFPKVKYSAHVAPKRYSTQLLEYGPVAQASREKKYNGEYHMEAPDPRETYDVHTYPCWTTPFWKNTWANLSSSRTALGLDGFHIDELGSYTSFDHQCFNRDHGHPIGGGTTYAQTRRDMVDIIRGNARRVNPDFAAHHEVLCEIYIDKADLAEVCTSPTNNNIPLYSVVYHDYNFTMGRRIIKYTDRRTYPKMTDPGTGGIREPGDQGMEEFVASFAETFIWGNQPAWMRADIASYAPKVAAITKKFMDARYRNMKFLNVGEMMRPLTLNKQLPTVKTIWRMNDTPEHIQPAILNSVWKAADGKIGIVLANISQQKQTIDYRFDLAEAGLKGKKFKVFRTDGTKRVALGESTGSMLRRADTVEPWSVKIIEIAPVP